MTKPRQLLEAERAYDDAQKLEKKAFAELERVAGEVPLKPFSLKYRALLYSEAFRAVQRASSQWFDEQVAWSDRQKGSQL